VTLLLQEVLPLLLALAPEVREEVGLADWVLLELRVVEPVLLLVPVAVELLVPVAVPEGLPEGVALLLSEVLPLVLALAPVVREEVGLADSVLLPLTVLLSVLAPVPVLL
jgi:hypothetical protein